MSGEGESLPVTQGLEYRVKLGKSFTFPERNAFHSLKCKLSNSVIFPSKLYCVLYSSLNNAQFQNITAGDT